MKLTKIYSDDCHVCTSLGTKAIPLAKAAGWDYDAISLEELANNPSDLRDYVVNYHVSGVDGMIDLPVYVITTSQGSIQGSSVVENLDEVQNLIDSWKQWEVSQKP